MQKIFIILTVSWFSLTEGGLCSTKKYSLLDTESFDHLSCPGPNDPPNWTECCGPSFQRRCCPHQTDDETIRKRNEKIKRRSSWDDEFEEERQRIRERFFDDDDWDDDEINEVFEGVAKFVGIAIGLIAFLIFGTILCCCCAPCCFFAKRRRVTRGVIHNPQQGGNTGAGPYPVQMTQTTTPYPPQPQPYPPQTTPYPPQPQPYPPQPQPQPYSDLPPPYPGPPAGWPGSGNPPAPDVQTPMMSTEYRQKQPAFNPNMK